MVNLDVVADRAEEFGRRSASQMATLFFLLTNELTRVNDILFDQPSHRHSNVTVVLLMVKFLLVATIRMDLGLKC